ncbi:bifunctional 4-hydroxy-2-oxoglutarate aldolase/2-dehydro-3-deoxy-phosphogluconate aldolase [Oxynema sp. CENA135]|uniref:bifunctional 4-hydroxy-2-oxoglutarate aldolase/2-dehydro-3-deoxy-phosphogluconate aldolase n=1 Tax=Oxynema sp. CENA135 TaxID=984206 RepID=UPI00190A0CBE|nr:bifunctional 4-hydroxy-2-oxoglutarate aldolase/2-dehydro-3-deoxy-phosphogluconate aldolase [Oxynema sp. CENA135]MBK4732611.1 bifunctional 4-hydroxy-2-oxoglutarate aldolase/2-dehydro-3-deoxy-phosphogluconate aldolase [Oxynema sp. CENA135]
MSRSWLTQLQQQSCIAVIRAPELEVGRQLAHAVASGGMRAIEITWNSDRPADLIAQLRAELPDCTIGTGTLMTVDDVERAIAAGAQFLFSPHVNPDLIARAIAAEVPIVPGALSPTEIVTAWQAGATAVKVFPISAVGGPSYIKSLQGPLGQIPLIPTGGVTLANTPEFLASGAIAVGLAGDLFPKAALDRRDWTAIGDRVAELIAAISHTRAAIAP